MKYKLLFILFNFYFLSCFCANSEKQKVDSCLFSEDGRYALILELSHPISEKINHITYGLYLEGKSERNNFIQLINDTAYYLNSNPEKYYNEYDSFCTKQEFINRYKLFKKGIDYTKQFNITIDSGFVRNGLPYLENGQLDTFCTETNFYDFYITYTYPNKTKYKDTLFYSNTSSISLIDIFNQQEKIPNYSLQGDYIGTIGYGTKIYIDKDFRCIFLRTKYIKTYSQTKRREYDVDVVNPETGYTITQRVASEGYRYECIDIRTFIKN